VGPLDCSRSKEEARQENNSRTTSVTSRSSCAARECVWRNRAAFLPLFCCFLLVSSAVRMQISLANAHRKETHSEGETVSGGATVQLNFSSTLAQCQSNVSPNRALLRPSERRKHWPNATSQPQSAGPEASFGSGAVCDYPAGLQLQWASPKGQSSATSRRELQQNCGRISGE